MVKCEYLTNESLIFSIFSGVHAGPCKDFTIKDCNIRPSDIIDILPAIDPGNCQAFCIDFSNCDTFQYRDNSCTLLSSDYRQECQFNAGPMVIISKYFIIFS